jgi:hypothetical protein
VSADEKVSTAWSHTSGNQGDVERYWQDRGVLMDGVVVEDHVDHFAGRHRALDGIKEAQELLVPVALHAAADHGALEHVERGEQRGHAMALE